MIQDLKFFPIAFFLIAVLYPITQTSAQNRICTAETILKQQLENDPEMRSRREEIELHTQEFAKKRHTSDRTVVTIPVVVNVVWVEFLPGTDISDEQIESQIAVLNEDFRKINSDINNIPNQFGPLAADCEINFCLAKQDPFGCFTTGIRRRMFPGFTAFDSKDSEEPMKFDSKGGLDAWDRDKYLNIWVCPLSQDVLGYAQFPGGRAETDGVVIDPTSFGTIGSLAPFNKGRTTTHEVAHWLNCFHVWGPYLNSCDDSDLVNDTPNQDRANYGCPSFPHISCNNNPNGDMFMNFMDYVDDECMMMFTEGQKMRMQATLSPLGGARSSLLSSSGCLPPCGCASGTTDIYTNTLYSTDMGGFGDIIVHSGAELTIEATITMPPGSRILVERNARLIIDNGGKVTRCGPDWKGIQVLGNNQKVQPERFAPLTDPSQAGIVWIDRGTVEGALVGVSAGGGRFDPEFGGGLIWTNLATFQNNLKAVEFFPYKFTTNKSRFFETTFAEIDDALNYTEGVTIWETDDIEFHKCTFANLDQEGIRAYDAAFRVLNSNKFEDNKIGISTYSTYPMSRKTYIGSGATTENVFTNNTFHVIAENIAGFDKYSLDIINNIFNYGQFGVVVEGGSNFRIAGNILQDGVSLVSIRNTGFNNLFNQNLIGCNLFRYSGNGITASGNNREMQFLGNDFQSCCYDFFLKQSSASQLGSIRSIQGDLGTPAANCFNDPPQQPDIIANVSETTSFRYYYQGNEPPFDCDVEPLTPGNYSKQFVLGGQTVIDCDQFGGLPQGVATPTTSDLNSRRTTLLQLAPYISTDENALNQYYRTLQEKDAILRYLLEQNVNPSVAESLLQAEQSKAADWTILGLRIERKDYVGAVNWLSQLPVQSVEDVQFRDIQLINLQRLQNPETFQLTAAQEVILNTVAASDSPIRGFARGILGLLKDQRFYPEDFNSTGGLFPSPPPASRQSGEVTVFPVPASSALNVSWPALSVGANAKLLVYDIYGREQLNQQISAQETEHVLETGHLPNGVYFLILTNNDKSLHQTRFVIQH